MVPKKNNSFNTTNNNSPMKNTTFKWAQKTVNCIIKTRQQTVELSNQVIKLKKKFVKLKKKNGHLKLQARFKDMVIANQNSDIVRLKQDLEKQKQKAIKNLLKTKEVKEPEGVHLGTDLGLEIKPYLDGSALMDSVQPFLDTVFK